MAFRRHWRVVLLALLCSLAAAGGQAGESPPKTAVIGLIIDDLGDRLDDGISAVSLPGAVTCAILPQTTYSRRLAELAHSAGKEVMLHQPMQAMNGKRMGPGGMGLHMTRHRLLDTLEANLASVPHVRGINNHMGSLLTRHPGHMAWLMAALRQRGDLYFVDSTTTAHTVALQVATEHALPSTRRNIFLDHHRDERRILGQFVRLIQRARSTGHALAIGHPYPETLAVLQKVLPHIKEFGVRLVPVSELIKHERREQLWQASLSPLHRGVKNSKR